MASPDTALDAAKADAAKAEAAKAEAAKTEAAKAAAAKAEAAKAEAAKADEAKAQAAKVAKAQAAREPVPAGRTAPHIDAVNLREDKSSGNLVVFQDVTFRASMEMLNLYIGS
jgi:ATPase subunit of ABC transporter with duplicated ATPase domains